MFRLSMSLLAVAFVCALTLSLIYKQTAPIIEEQKQILLEKSLQSVIRAESYEKKQEDVLFYEAKDSQGKISGWALPMSAKGYGGDIQLLVGIDKQKNITGVKVLEHKETPGLGSKISEIEYKQTEPEFLKQFKNKPVDDIVLTKNKTGKNIQAITGATVSSKAVTEAVRLGARDFLKNR